MKSTIFLVLICSTLFQSYQKNNFQEFYIVEGQIKNYNGEIYLQRSAPSTYYNDFEMDSIGILEKTIVINGKFKFKLKKKNNFPLVFHIGTDKTKTYDFILEPKNQQLIIDSLYYNVSPKIICKNSTIQDEEKILNEKKAPSIEEFKSDYKKIKNDKFPKDSVETFMTSLRNKLSYESNLALKNFTKDYPNSYVGFWDIVKTQMYDGYDIELESAYDNLSDLIKKSEQAKIFEKSMLEAKTLKNGKVFPKIKLQDKKLKEIIFNATQYSNSKYILVDYWFSYCAPCIAQFPKLNELQKKYSPKQLKIISISTDKTDNLTNWNKVMEREQMNWLNLIDINGNKTSALGINKFPTNYLLNSEGIILQKDISLMELQLLLEQSN
jgi:thiol-disulfide isomerase/thioredoxin